MAVRREKNWNAAQQAIARTIRQAVAESGVIVQREIVLMLSRPGSGRYYARNKVARSMAGRFGELDASAVMRLQQREAARVARAAARGRRTQARNLRELGVHRASAPGQPPAVDTGQLRASIQIDPSGLSQSMPTNRVGTNLVNARPLEYGTFRMAPRPYMRLALKRARELVLSMFRQFLSVHGRVR